ncbi:MAG: hypothetical protein ACRDR6_15405 [Pseudonocardiaceae bacterium]
MSIQLRWADSGQEVCLVCRRGGYWECNECDILINSGSYCGSCADDLDDGVCHCPRCEGYRDDTGGLINSYAYKPRPVFHGEGPMFLGLELEIESHGDRGEDARTAADCLGGLGYLKSDGSIDYGFEIVTHPMSYPWAMERFPWRMLDQLKANGAGGDHAGLHVHISRAAFTSACHTYRWIKFLYRNADRVKTVARRTSDEWAAFQDTDRKRAKDYAKGARDGYRYRAINTQNQHTFELRVFAASLERQEVQAALGLAAASVDYTRDLTVADIARRGGWDWSAFTHWLAERDEYAPLRAELEHLACAC